MCVYNLQLQYDILNSALTSQPLNINEIRVRACLYTTKTSASCNCYTVKANTAIAVHMCDDDLYVCVCVLSSTFLSNPNEILY